LGQLAFDYTGSIRITHPDRDAFLRDLGTLMAERQSFTVATMNLDHVVKLRRDPGFAVAYRAHSHVVADGNPIVWLSRLAGQQIDLIPGSELIDPLCVRAAAAEVGVAFIGATEETLEKAAAELESRHHGLRVVCRIAPPMGFDPDGESARAIASSVQDQEAGLCFLALGAPKQERLAARLKDLVPRCGFVSIGVGLDFIAGSQTRAPLWIRRLALEWVWRMLGNPGRLAARYGACIAIMPALTARALRSRAKH
jgi:exopolysaccharide biosynthesis WecB/TagA/CpsF family protein